MLQYFKLRIPVEKYTESTLDLSYGTAVSSIVEKKSGFDDSMIFGNIIFRKTPKFMSGLGQKTSNYLEKIEISKSA